MLKHEKVNQWIQLRTQPFDREDASKACGCSSSVVSAALERYFQRRIKFYVRHVGSGNFRNTFFPLDWTDQQCREYMNKQTKSGNSKAQLYLYRVGALEVVKEE